MGAKLVAGIIAVIILIVLIQTCILDDDDASPSISRPGSIPTATPPAEGSQPVLLGEGSAGSGSSAQSTSGPSGNTYTVQSGDTLGAIAQRFSVPADGQAAWIAEVLRLNNMQDARQLQAGQELKLPTIAATARPSGTAASGTPTQTPRASSTGTVPTQTPRAGGGSASTYTVVSGDSAFLIAEKHCVADPGPWVEELLEINNVEASALRVGEVLDLPSDTPALCQTGGAPTATPTP
jgi:LysM repeat protein